MNVSADLKFLRDNLAQWAQTQGGGGTAEIAVNFVHLFALLGTKPGGFRAAVKWKGEDKRGEFEETGFVDCKYWIALSFGNSMLLNKGEAMVKGSAGGDPWGDIVESCRDLVRGLVFDPNTTESGPNYLGCHELVDVSPEFLLDGFYLEFLIGKQLPPPAAGGAIQQ